MSNKELYPSLYKLVVKNMIHDLCEKYGSTKSGIVNDKCKFHYPRAFCSQKLQGKNKYPIYRRRTNGYSVKIKKKIIDNRWIAPYNPYLLTRYNCHINVEICSSKIMLFFFIYILMSSIYLLYFIFLKILIIFQKNLKINEN